MAKLDLNISDLDFDSIKTNLKNFLKSSDTFKDYNFEGSSLNTLLDVLAYNTFYHNYYLNAVANESFLETAKKRSSIVSHAKKIGYRPKTNTSSKAVITLKINATDSPTTILVPKYSQFSTTLDNTTYLYHTLSEYTISRNTDNEYILENLPIYEGNLVKLKETVTAANTSNYTVVIDDEDVVLDSLTVTTQPNLTNSALTNWTFEPDITNYTSSSYYFDFDETSTGVYQLKFGDDNFGVKLKYGNIINIEYLSSSADSPNGASNFELLGTISGYSDVDITTVLTSSGGVSKESLESIRTNAPKSYKRMNRIVTLEDYKTALEEYLTIAESTKVWGGEDNNPPVFGKVFIAVKPYGESVISEAAKQNFIDSILGRRKIVSIIPEFVDAKFLNLVINATVKYDSNSTTDSPGTIQEKVKNLILNYGTENVGKFDLIYRTSALSKYILDSDSSFKGLTISTRIKNIFTPNTTKIDNYTLYFDNTIHYPHFGHRGAIVSTNFSYKSTTGQIIENCFIEDNDGILVISAYRQDIKIIVNNNIGNVDYGKGILNLIGFKPESYTGDFSLTVLPDPPNASELIAKLNRILLISDNDIEVSAIKDNQSVNYYTDLYSN